MADLKNVNMKDNILNIGEGTSIGLIGSKALLIGTRNYINGYYAGIKETDYLSNTIGIGIGNRIVGGTYNTMIGPSGSGTSSTIRGTRDSIALGYNATSQGDYNVVIGANSCSGQSITRSVVIASPYTNGSASLGNNSVIIGGYGPSGSNRSNVIAVGANYSSLTSNNTIVFGDDGASISLVEEIRCNVTSISSISDVNDKIDIKELLNVSNFLRSLETVSFKMNPRSRYFLNSEEDKKLLEIYGMCNYDKEEHKRATKKSDKTLAGFLAQDVYELLKTEFGSDNYMDLVNRDGYNDLELGKEPRSVEDRYFIQYTNFVPVIVKGIQELDDKINDLYKTINKIEEVI